MRDNEERLLLELFRKMTAKDRKWFISTAADTVQENPAKQPNPALTLIIGSRRAS